MSAGEVLLCEHDPVFTFGLRERDYQSRAEKLLEETKGCEVVKVSCKIVLCAKLSITL